MTRYNITLNKIAVNNYGRAFLQCECETPNVTLRTPFMERNGYRNGGGWWVGIEGVNEH